MSSVICHCVSKEEVKLLLERFNLLGLEHSVNVLPLSSYSPQDVMYFLFQHTFGLLLMTKIGLILSLLCLILCMLTFKLCRSIQGTRTTIHLHLCICLFMADLIFLAGISQTKPVVCL